MMLSARCRLTLAAAGACVLATSCAASNTTTALPTLGQEPTVAAAKPTPDAQPKVERAEAEVALAIPTECHAANGAVCTPPKKLVTRLCGKRVPDVALTFFAKSSPWTRAYVTRDMEAWYVSPDAQRSSPKQLRRFEEVIILSDRSAPPGGIQISGAGSYDVYRWDGSCVSVMSDEVSLRSPGTPDVATIPWKRLDDDITERLVKDRKIEYRNEKRLELCKKHGEQATLRCERAKTGLSRMIAEFVRGGGDLPLLTAVP
jgi:hypothetical protein